jgi:tetratricopeptide (TPR) repeat protein
LRDNGAEYIVSAGVGENNRPYEFAMKETDRFWFEPVYALNGLLLYKVHSAFVEPPPPDAIAPSLSDTNTAAGFLRLGRTLLLKGDCPRAIDAFAKAFSRGSNPPLTMFEMTIAYAMAGQRAEANKSLELLYQLPQSTSYIPAATVHLRAMEDYLNAKNIQGLYHRSSELFNVAGFYWNFGYPNQGYTILRDILKEDTTYFVGLLWGWDYANRLGDAKQAHVYFKMLESLDPTNAVVTGFRSINAIDDSLRRLNNPVDQSRLLLEKGKTLWSIGLFDDAFDNVERSIGKNRSNKAAQQYLAELFKKSNKPWAVRKVKHLAVQ